MIFLHNLFRTFSAFYYLFVNANNNLLMVEPTMGQNVHVGSCLRGELSMWQAVHGASCPWGELSKGRTVNWASCP
jgi:hypothetical protein